MPHVKLNTGAGFLTPTITKGQGKDAVNINAISGGGAQLALAIAYLMEVGAYTTDKDNRLENKTARKSALLVKDAINTGKPEDVFVYHFPAATAEGEMDNSKLVAVMSCTRADLVKVINAVSTADSILSKAESEVAKLVPSLKEVAIKSLNPAPVYNTEGGGRAKRGGKSAIQI